MDSRRLEVHRVVANATRATFGGKPTAFLIQDHGWQCQPGAVFPDVVASSITTHLPHLYFTSPFVWEADLGTRVLENKTVTWLLAAPISDAERIFVESNGPDALEDLFEHAKIDICDINRRSVA
jgi:hypothetical protein